MDECWTQNGERDAKRTRDFGFKHKFPAPVHGAMQRAGGRARRFVQRFHAVAVDRVRADVNQMRGRHAA